MDLELCTPTGAALLTALADDWGPQPAMAVDRVGVGAGGRDPAGHANVLRLLVGESSDVAAPTGPPTNPPTDPTSDPTSGSTAESPTGTVTTSSTGAEPTRAPSALVLEANVDDLDPRIWPTVIAALLEAGASDAWLTPILMKKGRPAHTLSVLVAADRAERVRREVFRHTTTIGLREHAVAKTELQRDLLVVEVEGHRVEVKVALLDDEVVNAQPEFEHVAAAARALDLPVKTVLATASALARPVPGHPAPPGPAHPSSPPDSGA